MSFPRYPAYKDSGVEWLGQLPSHWKVCRTKDLFSLMKRAPLENDEIVTAFRDGEVTLRANRRVEGFTNAIHEHGYQRILRGDLVIHAMDAFAGAIGVSDSDGKSTPVYSVCTPKSTDVDTKYFGRLMRYMAVSGYINALAKGIRERSTEFRWNEASNVRLALPPVSEQTNIVHFLDRETAKIDALVVEQRRLMELLKEKRQAVISHAVTQGLNPNAPMKPSGIEWLGDVPEHWEVVPLKRLVTESVAGPYGASLTKDMYCESGYRVYGQQQVIQNDFSIGDYFIDQQKYDEMVRYTVFPSDLLISVMGTIGQVAVVPDGVAAGIINPRLVRYRCSTRINPRHLKQVLMSRAHQEHLLFESKGSTMNGLNMQTIGAVPVPVPPPCEQDAILNYASKHSEQYDTLTTEAQRAIDLLQERRTALISAAVTGQIDVRIDATNAPISSTKQNH